MPGRPRSSHALLGALGALTALAGLHAPRTTIAQPRPARSTARVPRPTSAPAPTATNTLPAPAPLAPFGVWSSVEAAAEVVIADGDGYLLGPLALSVLSDDLRSIARTIDRASLLAGPAAALGRPPDAGAGASSGVARPYTIVGAGAGLYAVWEGARSAEAGQVQALAPRPGEPSWTATVFPPQAVGAGRHIADIERAGASVVAFVPRADLFRLELVSLDAATGHERWRRVLDPAGSWWHPVAISSHRLYVAFNSHVALFTAYDTATGAVAWTPDLRCLSTDALAADDAEVALGLALARGGANTTSESEIRIYDGATGGRRASAVVPGVLLHGLAFDRDTLYAMTGRQPALDRQLVAFDRATLRVRWRSAAIEGSNAAGPLVLPGAGAVAACLPDGVLRVFDRRTGQVQWQWGLGTACSPRLLRRRSDGAPAVLVVAPRRDRSVAMVFAPGGAVAPLEHATIQGRVTDSRGRPLAGESLRVGDRVAQTDAAGRYHVTLDARGVVRVEAMYPGSARPQNTLVDDPEYGQVATTHFGNVAVVELDGRATAYPGDLVVRPHCPEGCR